MHTFNEQMTVSDVKEKHKLLSLGSVRLCHYQPFVAQDVGGGCRSGVGRRYQTGRLYAADKPGSSVMKQELLTVAFHSREPVSPTFSS